MCVCVCVCVRVCACFFIADVFQSRRKLRQLRGRLRGPTLRGSADGGSGRPHRKGGAELRLRRNGAAEGQLPLLRKRIVPKAADGPKGALSSIDAVRPLPIVSELFGQLSGSQHARQVALRALISEVAGAGGAGGGRPLARMAGAAFRAESPAPDCPQLVGGVEDLNPGGDLRRRGFTRHWVDLVRKLRRRRLLRKAAGFGVGLRGLPVLLGELRMPLARDCSGRRGGGGGRNSNGCSGCGGWRKRRRGSRVRRRLLHVILRINRVLVRSNFTIRVVQGKTRSLRRRARETAING